VSKQPPGKQPIGARDGDRDHEKVDFEVAHGFSPSRWLLNATPRRCLGYRTPAEVFNGHSEANPAEAGPAAAMSH